mgnify:CR=1 FL=1|jgi:hypothetical protein
MGKENKEAIFREFAEKAKKRIEERKKFKTKQVYVEKADVNLTLHGLTEEEISECTEMYDSALENDKYTIYLACKELQEVSGILVEEGILKENERYKITDMFDLPDRTALTKEILALSGFGGESSVREVEEVKN